MSIRVCRNKLAMALPSNEVVLCLVFLHREEAIKLDASKLNYSSEISSRQKLVLNARRKWALCAPKCVVYGFIEWTPSNVIITQGHTVHGFSLHFDESIIEFANGCELITSLVWVNTLTAGASQLGMRECFVFSLSTVCDVEQICANYFHGPNSDHKDIFFCSGVLGFLYSFFCSIIRELRLIGNKCKKISACNFQVKLLLAGSMTPETFCSFPQ